MTINYTTLLGLAQPVTGTEANTWGTAVNDEITALLDTAVAGTTTLSADADVTLTTTAGAANQARQAIILWTASGSTTRNITAPAQSKTYMVINATSSTQSIVLRGVGPTTGVTIVAGERCVAAWNGSDFVKVSSNFSFAAPVVIEGTTTSAALRITQLGTGNALLVEDSSNPDATPFVIDASGRVVVGYTSSIDLGNTTNIQSYATGASSGLTAVRWSADAIAPRLQVGKSRSATIGTNTIVQSGDDLGGLYFYGDDGTDLISSAASIIAEVDGTPGVNDMPGRLVFSTTADSASTPTERMRIDSSGNVGIGTTAPATNGATYATLSLNGSNGGALHFMNAGTTVMQFYNDANALFLNASSGKSTIFQTASTERMRIASDGKVGVGTASATSLLQTAGSSSVSAFRTPNIAEVNTISATAATGTIAYDVTTQSVLYYTTNASGNFTVNFRGSSGTTLNTVMQTGESISATFLVTNGATAYYNSAVQVDGSSVTPKWQGGTAPTSGNASSIDSYTYVIIKTGSAAFTVLASVTKFA